MPVVFKYLYSSKIAKYARNFNVLIKVKIKARCPCGGVVEKSLELSHCSALPYLLSFHMIPEEITVATLRIHNTLSDL